MNFFLALAANTLFYFGFQALFPTLPLYVDHLGGTPTDNGLLTLAFALTAVLSRPFLGSLTDRWGRKPLMLIGAAIFVAAPLGYAASHTVMALLLARAFQGIGIAAFTTAYQALIVDLAPAAIDGVPTVILSLAARGDRVAAGTIDGRIAIYRLDR